MHIGRYGMRPQGEINMSYFEVVGKLLATQGFEQYDQLVVSHIHPTTRAVTEIALDVLKKGGWSAWASKEAVRLRVVGSDNKVHILYVTAQSAKEFLGHRADAKIEKGLGLRLASVLSSFAKEGRKSLETEGQIPKVTSQRIRSLQDREKPVAVREHKGEEIFFREQQAVGAPFHGQSPVKVSHVKIHEADSQHTFSDDEITRMTKDFWFQLPDTWGNPDAGSRSAVADVESFWNDLFRLNHKWEPRLPRDISPEEAHFVTEFLERRREQRVQRAFHRGQLLLPGLCTFVIAQQHKALQVNLACAPYL